MREKDSAFLILAPLHHDFNFIAGLELDIAFSVSHFGNGNQSFGFKANVYNDVGCSDLHDAAFENIVFTGRRFGFKGVRLKCGCEIVHVVIFFVSDAHAGLLGGLNFRISAGHRDQIIMSLGVVLGLRRGFESTCCVVVWHSLAH